MQMPRLMGAPTVGSGGAGNFSNAAAPASKDGQQTGAFNPEELERGAAALKDIDKSKHSVWAFDLAVLQERTVQYQTSLEMEKERTSRMQVEEGLLGAQAEQARQTVSHRADEERNTAQYRAQVEHSLQGSKLEKQREALGYQLQREQEQFLQHEAIRIRNEQELEAAARETLRHRGSFMRESAVAEALAEARGRAQQERENIDVRLREMRSQKSEERTTRLAAIEEMVGGLSNGLQALYEDRTKLTTLVVGLTGLAVGVYGARAATRVAGAMLERYLGRPPLVRETSRWTWRPRLMGSVWPWGRKDTGSIFEQIVLEEALAERLRWTTNALVSAQDNGTPFRHLLLHGPPGTGKTLFARTLARSSGLDYAVMSGGDLGPLGREGPHELHKLFGWAARSPRGLILFIDEADAFLRRGRSADGKMGEDARNALSVFLHHTGTENTRLAVILATNVPSVLDRAVLDRIDEAFEFPRPAYDQRVQLLQLFMDTYLRSMPKNKGKGIELDPALDGSFLEEVAKRTDGLSGRQLAKLVLAFQSAVFGSGTQRLTVGLAETVLQWRLAHPSA